MEEREIKKDERKDKIEEKIQGRHKRKGRVGESKGGNAGIFNQINFFHV
jgi:hypothetical protein